MNFATKTEGVLLVMFCSANTYLSTVLQLYSTYRQLWNCDAFIQSRRNKYKL